MYNSEKSASNLRAKFIIKSDFPFSNIILKAVISKCKAYQSHF